MNKQFILKLIAALSIILLAAGCNAKEADSNQAKDEKKEASAQKTEKKVKEDELSAEEIFEKANESFQEWPGISGRLQGVTNARLAEGKERLTLNEEMDAELKLKTDPFAMQMTGNTVTDGEKMSLSSYYKDKTLYYEPSPDEGWFAIDDEGPGSPFPGNLKENPADLINIYHEIIKELQKANISHEYLKKSEEDSQYVLSLNLDKKAIATVKDQIYKLVEYNLEGEVQDTETLFKNLEVKRLHITFNIGKKTAALKKMKAQINYSLVLDGTKITMESTQALNDLKKYTGDITVPDEVMKNAYEVTKQELEDATQLQ